MHIFSTSVVRPIRLTTTILLAALLGWSITFGWSNWSQLSGKLNAIEFNSTWIKAINSYAKTDQSRTTHEPFPEDAARALSEIQKYTKDPITVVSNWNGLASTNVEGVWSAFHGPANIALFPSPIRRRYLAKTASTLKRSGWLIISRTELGSSLLADFDSAYIRTNEREFGTFHAIRYAPK